MEVITEGEEKKPAKPVGSFAILGSMVHHVWPKDRTDLKMRVVGALGLLVGAKVYC